MHKELEWLQPILKKAGFHQWGIVPVDQIEFSHDVRKMCEANTCRMYGKTWSCPPGIGTIEECRERLLYYDKLLVFSGKYNLEDSFDFEGMMDGMKSFKDSCRILDELTKGQISNYLILSNEGCDLCKNCTYPDAPCRFPDRAHGSLEGYGIFVNKLAEQAGINYINGVNTMSYFGGLAYSNQDIMI